MPDFLNLPKLLEDPVHQEHLNHLDEQVLLAGIALHHPSFQPTGLSADQIRKPYKIDYSESKLADYQPKSFDHLFDSSPSDIENETLQTFQPQAQALRKHQQSTAADVSYLHKRDTSDEDSKI